MRRLEESQPGVRSRRSEGERPVRGQTKGGGFGGWRTLFSFRLRLALRSISSFGSWFPLLVERLWDLAPREHRSPPLSLSLVGRGGGGQRFRFVAILIASIRPSLHVMEWVGVTATADADAVAGNWRSPARRRSAAADDDEECDLASRLWCRTREAFAFLRATREVCPCAGSSPALGLGSRGSTPVRAPFSEQPRYMDPKSHACLCDACKEKSRVRLRE